jgi:biopolymer transport protein ExbB
MLRFLMIQADLATEMDTLATGTEGISTKFIDLAFKGGWIMIPIILLSVIGVYIFFDRYFAIKRAGKFDTGLLEKVRVYITSGKVDEAMMLCRSSNNPASRMLEKGLSRIGRPLSDVTTAIENVGNLEISKLEKGLPVLASVAGGAPMLGFLGTVMGMIQAFYDMANAGNNIDVTLLSTGIYQAMVTTVAGLIVGIIAYFAYNILVSSVEKVVFKMEATTSEFMDLLNEPA